MHDDVLIGSALVPLCLQPAQQGWICTSLLATQHHYRSNYVTIIASVAVMNPADCSKQQLDLQLLS